MIGLDHGRHAQFLACEASLGRSDVSLKATMDIGVARYRTKAKQSCHLAFRQPYYAGFSTIS